MAVLHTLRLTIRVARVADAPVFAAYRSNPEIAKYQDWDMPYQAERALTRLTALEAFDDVAEGEWISFAIEHEGEVVGDVVASIREGGGIAELGFTLAPEHHGRGYASEAASAMVDHLIANHGVHRIEASLDPENVASMRVLEGLGMRQECLAPLGYLVRGEWVDDLRYAMTAVERRAWVDRPRTPPASVEIVEITPDDAYLWGRLATHHSQERFVSPMAVSFRDALFPEAIDTAWPKTGGEMVPVVPWMRGVLADGERAGFVMLAQATEHHPVPYLWRLLIDRRHQRRSLGRSVLDLLTDQLRRQGHTALMTSWGEGQGSPEPFYLGYGFVPTGDHDDDEVIGRLTL
ncbi:MAG: GNAT family N-acetyltransferase [Ilumatobacteraceae bacterium]